MPQLSPAVIEAVSRPTRDNGRTDLDGGPARRQGRLPKET